jgi:hypothetical protein
VSATRAAASQRRRSRQRKEYAERRWNATRIIDRVCVCVRVCLSVSRSVGRRGSSVALTIRHSPAPRVQAQRDRRQRWRGADPSAAPPTAAAGPRPRVRPARNCAAGTRRVARGLGSRAHRVRRVSCCVSSVATR